MQKLNRQFYQRETSIVAQELLGKYLIHESPDGVKRIGKIVEVEAYLGPHDLASHSSKGITKRTAVMFGPAGYAYVYLIYGIHYCFNVVTEQQGHGSAVLIRALEPVQNIVDRTQGPGLLTKAMRINQQLNGEDLLSRQLYLADPISKESFTLARSPRIGVAYAKEWANESLRFYIKDNSFVSKRA